MTMGGKEFPCAGIWRPRDYLIEKLAAGGVWCGTLGKSGGALKSDFGDLLRYGGLDKIYNITWSIIIRI